MNRQPEIIWRFLPTADGHAERGTISPHYEHLRSSPNSLEPIKLKHCLQGWPPDGPNAFRWENGRLTYKLADLSRDIRDWGKTVVPMAAQWEEFWRVCEEIDVWSWPTIPHDMRMCDGLQWITELEIGSQRVATRGQAQASPPEFTAKLMRLHGALQAMAGWQPPTEDT